MQVEKENVAVFKESLTDKEKRCAIGPVYTNTSTYTETWLNHGRVHKTKKNIDIYNPFCKKKTKSPGFVTPKRYWTFLCVS